MSTIATPDRFTTLPDEPVIASAVTAGGAANVIFVVGAQKLVPTLEAAHERIYQHSLVLEDARAIAAYGQHSSVGKILEIHQELPGRIHIVLIRQVVGF
jgi:LUD domain